ncbi:hypothetical protein PhCBS80983_g04571 [Powellomyces hirtus]|uniref:Uncharacterized protein n=1 Tax=Powellomyces hirtus TaxID=109895 RepID=A0A507DYZ2_9FUNG|nr:hypothetical protein PhCBS80983_g04571 [Powellomyces hirtus]
MSTLSTAKYAAAHLTTSGPGDARPTALQIIHDQGLVNQLCDKTIFITGAASGLGIETARALHATGARLYFGVRDTAKGELVADEIRKEGRGAAVDVVELHLDSLESVRKCAEQFLKKSGGKLNVLIANAGVMACPQGKTKEGFETQFGTNHLGHFLLFQLLKDALLSSSTPAFNSRVVAVSSMGHRSSPILFDDYNFEKTAYAPWTAYGQSKTANIYFANEIDRRYGSRGLHATSLHPGGIATPLQRHLDSSFMEMMESPKVRATMKSPEQGAATTVWAAVGKDWEGTGGKYLGDVNVGKRHETEKGMADQCGYAPWAYDQEAELKLWNLSNKLVGIQESRANC